ncbi:MAG TPA: glutamine synthetase family protein [Dongiaceae bacterium]|nr:glutamine synthetase family protein [Dongiaceae bacterium]
MAKSKATEFDAYLGRHPETVHVDAFLHDLNGNLRGKRLPVAEAAKLWKSGLEMPRCMLFLDPTGDDLDPGQRVTALGDPDGAALPIPGLLAPVPWVEEPTAQILLQMTDPARDPNHGKPSRYCPRAALMGTLAHFGKLGLTPVVAVELEFYLFDRDRDAEGLPVAVRNPVTGQKETSKQPYSIDDLDAYGVFIRRVAAYARQQDIPASAAITEYSPGQFEINLRHQADAVAACDNAVLLKRAIRAAARIDGHHASFMAKPFLDAAGSGMHIHVSLVDKQGRNMFGEDGAKGEALLRQAVAGLQAAMPESMAIFGANLNGFRRYQPGHNVPITPRWGFNNRSVAFRIPAGGGAARRIEHRVAGADANPYLVTAAVLAGMLHGITARLKPTAETTGDAGDDADPDVPFEFLSALGRFEKARILPRYVNPDMLGLMLDQRRAELAKFMGTVSRQEYDWYL